MCRHWYVRDKRWAEFGSVPDWSELNRVSFKLYCTFLFLYHTYRTARVNQAWLLWDLSLTYGTSAWYMGLQLDVVAV